MRRTGGQGGEDVPLSSTTAVYIAVVTGSDSDLNMSATKAPLRVSLAVPPGVPGQSASCKYERRANSVYAVGKDPYPSHQRLGAKNIGLPPRGPPAKSEHPEAAPSPVFT